jgi:hypothetical protein
MVTLYSNKSIQIRLVKLVDESRLNLFLEIRKEVECHTKTTVIYPKV